MIVILIVTVLLCATVSAIISTVVSFKAVDFLLCDATRNVEKYYSKYSEK